MQFGSAHSRLLLLPASYRFILFSLLLALIWNLAPWSGVGLMLRPDFLALVLLYWGIHQPRKIGMGTAWLMGLVIDVANGSLLGQHALAYCLMMFAALLVHRRILMFPLWKQALHVVLLLLSLQLATLFLSLAAGGALNDWAYLLSSLSGAMLWPALSFILQHPQRSSSRSETPYPAGHK